MRAASRARRRPTSAVTRPADAAVIGRSADACSVHGSLGFWRTGRQGRRGDQDDRGRHGARYRVRSGRTSGEARSPVADGCRGGRRLPGGAARGRGGRPVGAAPAGLPTARARILRRQPRRGVEPVVLRARTGRHRVGGAGDRAVARGRAPSSVCRGRARGRRRILRAAVPRLPHRAAHRGRRRRAPDRRPFRRPEPHRRVEVRVPRRGGAGGDVVGATGVVQTDRLRGGADPGTRRGEHLALPNAVTTSQPLRWGGWTMGNADVESLHQRPQRVENVHMRDGGGRPAGRRIARPRRWAAAVVALACVAAVVPTFAGRATGATSRKISAWIPNWDQTRAYTSFLANADLYDEAMPYWYEMKSPTSVMAYDGAEDPTFSKGIKAKGVRLVPTIANAFDGSRVSSMLSTSSNRTAHVNTIVNLVTSKGFDGIDVDYENMVAGDRANFTSFITQLATALHAKAKKLDVAVYAKTAEPGTWDGPKSEDYAALGKVVDRLQLMTYDYHWNTSAAGPIAPLSWVDQVASF